jgi:hypothetical protein
MTLRNSVLGASLIAACLIPTPVSAQWLKHPTPGVPRTADGKPNLTAPAPRTADGKPDLSGLWQRPVDRYYNNIRAGLDTKEVQPWAQALMEQRMREFGKDSMETLCLPLGVAALTSPFREWKFIQTPTLIVMLSDDLTHRQVFMDGRQLEKDPNPNWMGYSVGRWEGDTLVVESNGFSERTWLDWDGHPHTEALRVTERYTRRDFGHMALTVTLDDPKVYATPWTITIPMELAVDLEMLEYVCQENEKDRRRMDSKGPELSATTVPATTLARYAGIYDYVDLGGATRVVEISVADGALFFDQDRAGRQKLLPFSDSAFSLSGWRLDFISDAEGVVTHFLGRAAEGETKGTRRK